MKCGKPANVSAVLVGLHQVGIVGLRDVLKAAAESDLVDRDAVLDFIVQSLKGDNYIPKKQIEEYRRTIWREYLRYRGQDFRGFYSEIDVAVHGHEGTERDQFVKMLISVLGDFELVPRIDSIESPPDDATSELVIDGEVVVRGCTSRRAFKSAIRRRITEW